MRLEICWLGIKPIEEAGVNVFVFRQAAANWICANVFKLAMVIGCVPNPVLEKPVLPNFAGELGFHLEREAALDALSTAFNRLIAGGC